MANVEGNEVDLGQLWRSRSGGPSFVPAVRFADEDKWADDYGVALTTGELLSQYRLVGPDDELIVRWWSGLSEVEKQAALVPIVDGAVPPWLQASLLDAGVVGPEVADGDEPYVFMLPDAVEDFLDGERT